MKFVWGQLRLCYGQNCGLLIIHDLWNLFMGKIEGQTVRILNKYELIMKTEIDGWLNNFPCLKFGDIVVSYLLSTDY